MTPVKNPLLGLTLAELKALFPAWPAFRCGQLYHAIYQQGAREFDQITTLPKAVREDLAAHYTLRPLTLRTAQASVDGTQKWLFTMADGQEVETVHIPEETRGTLCISSQVGCTLTCTFCHTGTQTLVRNLTAAEILAQIMAAMDVFDDWGAEKPQRHVTNIVLMGMGEPLYNYDNTLKALSIALDPQGLGLSNRKITLSTSGVVPRIVSMGEALGINLAVSLHAPNDALRSQIMPINKKYPLADLMAACRGYPGVHQYRRITFEYVMLAGVNDSPAHAKDLIQLITDLPCKINLIPFNPWPGSPYTCSSDDVIEEFAHILRKSGLTVTVRRTRGEEILAACGQLKSESQRVRRGPVRTAELPTPLVEQEAPLES